MAQVFFPFLSQTSVACQMTAHNNTRPGIETLLKLLPMERDFQNCINLNDLSDVTLFQTPVFELISILIVSCSHVVFPIPI